MMCETKLEYLSVYFAFLLLRTIQLWSTEQVFYLHHQVRKPTITKQDTRL